MFIGKNLIAIRRNRLDYAFRTTNGIIFSVQGRVQQLKLVEAKNHKSKLKLIDSNQTVLTLDSDNNDTLNTKLDNLFQYLSNKMHPLSKQGLVGSLLIRTIVIIGLILVLFGSLDLNSLNLSWTEKPISKENSDANTSQHDSKVSQNLQSIDLDVTTPQIPAIQTESAQISSSPDIEDAIKFDDSDSHADQMKNSVFTDNEKEQLLEFLETIQTGVNQNATEVLINSLPERVLNFLIQSGILTEMPTLPTINNNGLNEITTLPEHILKRYQDETGIASIPRQNSWVNNNGLVPLPLPGGGNIKSDQEFADFGLRHR